MKQLHRFKREQRLTCTFKKKTKDVFGTLIRFENYCSAHFETAFKLLKK